MGRQVAEVRQRYRPVAAVEHHATGEVLQQRLALVEEQLRLVHRGVHQPAMARHLAIEGLIEKKALRGYQAQQQHAGEHAQQLAQRLRSGERGIEGI
ncbi:hypothetical protein D9M73_232430 [compost metagenome]